jgi:hypothetical protein
MADDYARSLATVRMVADERITLVEATVAALASRLKIKVWTYDHHFDASSGLAMSAQATGRHYFLTWPLPMISYLHVVSSGSANGPRQWSF